MTRFDDGDLATTLDALSEAERDALPFGVIGLDREGTVRVYSRPEAEQSGRGARPTVGLPYFDRIAPCMRESGLEGRIHASLAEGTLDLEFGHTGDFDDVSRLLRIRAVSGRDGVWLAIQRA